MAALSSLAAAGAAVALGASLAAPAAAAVPLSPATSLEPSRALFGDRIAAVATVAVDGSAVDPAGVRSVAGFGPLDTLSEPVVERERRGDVTILRYRWEVACLSEDCVPSSAPRSVKLPPLRVTATRRDGGSVSTSVPWPALSIAGRVSAKEAAATPLPFRLETQLPAPSYRAAPRTLEIALGATAAISLFGALLLAARELARLRQRRFEDRLAALSPLERALLLAREAERRGPDDRRRALSLLARVLGGPGSSGLGSDASQLAWSPPTPSPEQIESVAAAVEREVEPE